jgi:hypothetical protein
MSMPFVMSVFQEANAQQNLREIPPSTVKTCNAWSTAVEELQRLMAEVLSEDSLQCGDGEQALNSVTGDTRPSMTIMGTRGEGLGNVIKGRCFEIVAILIFSRSAQAFQSLNASLKRTIYAHINNNIHARS